MARSAAPTEVDFAPHAAAARRAQEKWVALPWSERRACFGRLRGVLTRSSDRIAKVIAAENGKSLIEALSQEIIPLSDAAYFLEKNAERLLRPEKVKLTTKQFYFRGRSCQIRHEPCGVIGIIGTWNYAFFISASQALFALAAGNGVLLKGAPESPRVTELTAELFYEAGFPRDLFYAVSGGRDAGEALCRAACDKYILTGSRQTGRAVLATLAAELKPAVMELSGADPYVILSDADWDLAVRTLVWASFQYSGQTCVAPRQVFVLEKDRARLMDHLKMAFESAQPFLDLQGVLRTPERVASESAKLRELEARGLRRIGGGDGAGTETGTGTGEPGRFAPQAFEAPSGVDLGDIEFMAPVFFVRFFPDASSIVQHVKALPYALALSVWTREVGAAEALVGAAKTGQAWVNDSLFSTALSELPFGGRGESGFGRTRGAQGLLELTDSKVVSFEWRTKRSTRHLWPYPPNTYEALSEIHRLLFGTSLSQKWEAVCRLVRNSFRA